MLSTRAILIMLHYFTFVFCLLVVLCLLATVFICQYQCEWLTGKLPVQSDLYSPSFTGSRRERGCICVR